MQGVRMQHQRPALNGPLGPFDHTINGAGLPLRHPRFFAFCHKVQINRYVKDLHYRYLLHITHSVSHKA